MYTMSDARCPASSLNPAGGGHYPTLARRYLLRRSSPRRPHATVCPRSAGVAVAAGVALGAIQSPPAHSAVFGWQSSTGSHAGSPMTGVTRGWHNSGGSQAGSPITGPGVAVQGNGPQGSIPSSGSGSGVGPLCAQAVAPHPISTTRIASVYHIFAFIVPPNQP